MVVVEGGEVTDRKPFGGEKVLQKEGRIARITDTPLQSVPLISDRTQVGSPKCSQFVVRNLTELPRNPLAMVEHDVSITTVTAVDRRPPMCPHTPSCPPYSAFDREAAHVIAAHPEQGWSLLCNGVIVFEDTGELLPDGRCVAPARPEPCHAAA